MNTKEIRQALLERPFEPITLRMNDGREFHVLHPEHLAVGHRVVMVYDITDEVGMFLEPILIASMRQGKLKKNGKKA